MEKIAPAMTDLHDSQLARESIRRNKPVVILNYEAVISLDGTSYKSYDDCKDLSGNIKIIVLSDNNNITKTFM